MNSPLVNRPAVPHRNKYGTRGTKITRVILHNWAGVSGGDTHLAKASVKASTNYLIYSDGGIAVQVPERYRAWTSGGAAADNPSITIETQNSTMGPGWEVSDRALDAIARLLADIAKRYGWGSITPDRLRGHREFQSTTCPGPYLWARMDQIRAEANKILHGTPAWDGNPVPGSWVSAVFGQKPKNNTYWQSKGFHTGRDYAAPEGTPVLAVVDGTVQIREDRVLGCITILSGDNGREYWYSHLRRGSRSPWKTGSRVRAGQQIAEVGQTGTGASGPHVHLEDSTSATTWGVGLRDPEWPPLNLPNSPNPATPRAIEPEEDPVPEHRETPATLTLDGTNWSVTDAVVPPSDKALRITAVATVAAPLGTTIKTRWVSWSGEEWVRYGVTEHPTHEVETSCVVGQAWPGADLRLDVWTNAPCEAQVHVSALVWEVP